MAKEFSPEEKLLKLIRSKSPAPHQAASDKGNVQFEPSKAPLFSKNIPAPLPKIEQPKQRSYLKREKVLKFENLNLALILLLAALLIYFIPLFLKKPKDTIQALEEKIKAQEKASAKKEAELKRPPFNYFSQEVGAKDVFQPSAKEEIPNQPAVEQGPKLEDIKGQLNLLGIVWGDNPQAIIEDKKAQKTYFLNKGGAFDDVEVKDILENKVILSYKDQQFELVL